MQKTRSAPNVFLLALFATLLISLVLIGIISFFAFQPLKGTRPSLSDVISPSAPPRATAIPSASLTASPTQKLLLTSTPTPGPLAYTVQSGDTLIGIATRFSTTVETIKALNNLQGDLIRPDQVLIISYPTEQPTLPDTPLATTVITSDPGGATYFVETGDTLDSIAFLYGLEVADLRRANAMIGDAILPGQRLAVPIVSPPASPVWRFSIIEGDLLSAYPLSLEKERFTLHYTPDTYPERDPEALARLVQEAIDHIERAMASRLNGRFDVYAAGSVFAPPDRALRGRTFSFRWQTFFLHDGTGNATDQQYIVAHELTHLFTWNVFGQPASIMLSEGAAVYTGMELIAGSLHIPLDQFCRAYLNAGALPLVSSSLSYQGHILDLENYYAAGCFVSYLIETYGPAPFGQLYPTGDFEAVYGRPLVGLEDEWREFLAANSDPGAIEPAELIATVEVVESAYQTFFSNFTGSEIQLAAYRELDKARIALLEGRLQDTQGFLSTFREILAGK